MERFVLHWGEMGWRWGINRSVAQVHALLMLTPKPIAADEIAETLNVARSPDEAERQAKGENVIAAGQAADKAAADEAAKEIAAAAQAAGFDRGPIDG